MCNWNSADEHTRKKEEEHIGLLSHICGSALVLREWWIEWKFIVCAECDYSLIWTIEIECSALLEEMNLSWKRSDVLVKVFCEWSAKSRRGRQWWRISGSVLPPRVWHDKRLLPPLGNSQLSFAMTTLLHTLGRCVCVCVRCTTVRASYISLSLETGAQP